MPITRVALVGHCGFDSGSLTRFAQDTLPDAEVTRINDQTTLDALLDQHTGPSTLLLINRVLDGRFNAGDSGIGLIGTLSKKQDAPALLLISNFAESQAQAIEAGALPGFGKSQLNEPATRRLLEAASTG